MIAKNVSIEDLNRALKRTNHSFKDNVIWNRSPDQIGKRYRFTLKVKSSKERGHGYGAIPTSKGNRRRLATACWHVHGLFFHHLIMINEKAIIDTTFGLISIEGGNWEDYPRGTAFNLSMASELCDCDSS